jgi:hypothetical protein
MPQHISFYNVVQTDKDGGVLREALKVEGVDAAVETVNQFVREAHAEGNHRTSTYVVGYTGEGTQVFLH